MVWTDKSVFTEVPDSMKNLHERDSATTTSITMDAGKEDNFLVAMSVMASNKTIAGYSTVPTDTIFVLDLSSSMRSNDNNGGSAIDELVDETNAAITRLLGLNNNCVGVVLYAGNTAGDWSSKDGGTVTILPLDRYSAGNNGRFLVSVDRVEGRDRYPDQRVEVAGGVKNGAGSNVTGAKDTTTGTFTQDGIYEAMKEFAKADPVGPDDVIQGGTVRMPILVLMSDGEPTMGNADFVGDTTSGEIGDTGVYNNLGNSVISLYNRDGYGEQDTRNSIAFITQLEAMYTYTVTEVKGTDSAVAYDETVYTVTIEVVNVDGILHATVTIDYGGELAFSNTYTKATPEDICVPIVIRKVLVNKSERVMTPAGFRFVMTDENGTRYYATSGFGGAAGFMLNYSEEDVGKTFIYTVREIDTGIEDVEYSKMVYTVWITISLNEETNELVATIRVNGVPMNPAVLTFINTYEPEIPEDPTEPSDPTEPTDPKPTDPGNDDVPDTSDNSNIVLWVLLAGFSAIGLVVLLPFKRKKGRYSR